jgi:hypothetical protein
MPNTGRIKIAGFKRLSFIVIFTPILSVIAAGLYYLARDVVSGFPDRRPTVMYYAIVSVGLLPFGLPIIFRAIYPAMVGAPALFIEDGYLIYIRKGHFCIPVKDAEVALTPSDNLFRKLILSVKNGRRTEIGLLIFDKSGSEIIEAVNASR